jgi:hypothetical protein
LPGHVPGSSRTPVEHARAHSLPLPTHITCSPWHIKGRAWVLFTLAGEEPPSSTSSHLRLKNYRDLGASSLSRPFVTPTTNQCK